MVDCFQHLEQIKRPKDVTSAPPLRVRRSVTPRPLTLGHSSRLRRSIRYGCRPLVPTSPRRSSPLICSVVLTARARRLELRSLTRPHDHSDGIRMPHAKYVYKMLESSRNFVAFHLNRVNVKICFGCNSEMGCRPTGLKR